MCIPYSDPRQKDQRRLARLAKEESNTVDAIVKMGVNDALQTKLQDKTAEKDDLEAQLANSPAKLNTLPILFRGSLSAFGTKY